MIVPGRREGGGVKIVVLDGHAVNPGDLSWAGLSAGRTTRGNRFLAPAAIELARAEEYATRLREAFDLGPELRVDSQQVRLAVGHVASAAVRCRAYPC